MDTGFHVIYQKKHFVIYQLSSRSYLVHNTKKDIGDGSTSIKKLRIAKDVLNWVLYETVPNRKLSPYILRGLVRLSDSKEYSKKITHLIKIQH